MSGTEQFIIGLLGAIGGLLLSAATLIATLTTRSKVAEVHQAVNGRMSQQLELASREAHAQGVLDGASAAAAVHVVAAGHPPVTGAELEGSK